MATTWAIAIDWDRNKDFSGTYDDITNRVISASWFVGISKMHELTADNPYLELTLSNADRLYSPDNAASPLAGKLVPQRPVRIQSNDGTTTRTHWVGWLESLQPQVSRYGRRTITLGAVGAMQFLKATETKLPLQQNQRTDAIISSLVQEVVFPPALTDAWILGRPTASELDASTRLVSTAAYAEYEPGTLTLNLAGDNWVRQGDYSDAVQDSFDVYRAIGDITAAERGRFYFTREGKAVFWNRHHLLQGATPAATFDDSMTDLVYSYAGLDFLKNELVVVCHPRSISVSTNDLLWSLTDAVVTLDPGQTRKIFVKYDDENGKRVGGKEVSITNVTCEQGSVSASVSPSANGAELTFVGGAQGAVIATCEVRGRKILDSGEMEASAADSASAIDFGRRTLRLNLPSVDNLPEAQAIAEFELRRRKNPRGLVSALTVFSQGRIGGGQHTQQLALTIGDLIRVKETQTGHDALYHIIGEAHELNAGATLWKTTWYLEPVPPAYTTPSSYPWKLGVSGRSELTTATALTY